MTIRMTEAFNNTAEYERDILPHIEAIWDKCKELNIPCILAVCHANTPNEDGDGTTNSMALAVNFCGPNKTPPSFMVANYAIDDSPIKAALAVIAGGLGQGETKVEHEDDSPAHDETVTVPM